MSASVIDTAVDAVRQLTAVEIEQRLRELREQEAALVPLYKAAVSRERRAKRYGGESGATVRAS